MGASGFKETKARRLKSRAARGKGQVMENLPSAHGASDSDIREIFDRYPNLTVAELARRTGKTIPQVKRILMPEK